MVLKIFEFLKSEVVSLAFCFRIQKNSKLLNSFQWEVGTILHQLLVEFKAPEFFDISHSDFVEP